MSTPIVSMFCMTPAELRANPALIAACKAMGLRAEMQCCRPLRDDESDAAYADHWDRRQGDDIAFLADNGIRFIARFDDAMRTEPEQEATRRSKSKILHVANRLAECGNCNGVEVLDETGADPASYPAREFVDLWRSVPGSPPISWPTLNPSRWLVPELSDYATVQWPWWTCSNGGKRLEMLEARLKAIPVGWETCLMLDVGGAFFRKYFPGLMGDEYTDSNRLMRAGRDALIYNRRSPSPENIAKQFDLAKRHGVKRIRLYQYDAEHVRSGRAEAKVGAKCETGVKFPSPEWDAIEHAIAAL